MDNNGVLLALMITIIIIRRGHVLGTDYQGLCAALGLPEQWWWQLKHSR